MRFQLPPCYVKQFQSLEIKERRNSKSQKYKKIPIPVAPKYSHRHLTRGATEIEGRGGNVSNCVVQQFQCCFGCNSFPCQ
jgi:hypothetical protein